MPAAAAATVIRSASLTGAQETPPTGATGTGRGAVVVNPTTLEITGGITFTGLTSTPPSAQHIHQAPSGNPTGSGAPIISLTLAPDNATATVPAGTFLTNAQYAALLAGELYFNVHTSPANPNGEIRGQINIQGGVTAGLATLNAAQESSTGISTATGRGTIVVNSASPYDILICYVTHNVTNTTLAHIHTGAPGASGPANVVTLTQGTNIYTAPVAAASTPPTALTTQNFADFMAGNTYFNVHSSNNFCGANGNTSCSGGEIRGQIAIQ
jgi:hypothetical protein